MKQTVAILGMGVSGLAVLLALAKHKRQDLQIFCFDDPNHFAKGIPFQDDVDSALINSPIDDISFDYQHMSDFIEWMEENNHNTEMTYVPRRLFGQYLSERADRLFKQLNVTLIKQRVDKITYLPQSQEWQCYLQGELFPTIFNHVHLACGQLPVIDPYQLDGCPNYIADPYPINNLAKQKWQTKKVGLIGTGLAAVDLIKWLIANTEVTISCFSRSSLLPTVRILEKTSISWQFLTDDNLQKLSSSPKRQVVFEHFEALLLSELEALGFKDWQSTCNQFLGAGIKGITLSFQYPNQLYLLQQLASRVADWFTDLWPLMSLSDRERYQEVYEKAIINLRNPMPDESAKVILKAYEDGRLNIIDDVTDIVPQHSGFSLINQSKKTSKLDIVINATGYQLTPSNLKSATPLLQSIIDQRLAQIDQAGGLSILPETTQVISPKYGIMPTLYAHGALVNGVIYQNNSTIKIQKMAERSIQPLPY
ncbi:FAD/NAD(P)-binding protein [Streptococcus pluranimalium]|uniref:FAD/NAD(P)-binding protein n=1 Tax=Streptococcus pluranimalium TaxID=82348 RepID=UPI0039FD82C0